MKGWIIPVSLLILVEAFARIHGITSDSLASPSQILVAAWEILLDGSLLTRASQTLLAALSGHQRAVVDYSDGAGSSHTTAEFPLPGLEKLRQPFLAACAKRGG